MKTSENKAFISSMILIIGTISAIIFHYSRFAFIPNYSPVQDSFLHYQLNIFCDFYSLFDSYVRLGFNAPINYLPSIYLPLEILSRISQNNPYISIRYVLGTNLILFIIFLQAMTRGINKKDRILFITAIVLFNYSVLFSFHTGNFEFICFILVGFAIITLIKEKYLITGILIGISASIKIYPAFFIASVINKNNYKAVISGFMIGFVIPLFLAFSINFHYHSNVFHWYAAASKGFANYNTMMIESYVGVCFGHSIINAFRIIVGPGYDVKPMLVYYYPLISVMAVITVIACVITKKRIFRILIIACYLSLFAPTSQDYKLLYFIIPLVMLVNDDDPDKYILTTVVLISILLIPKSYYYYYSDRFVTVNTLINAATIFILYVICLVKSKIFSIQKSI